MFGKDSVHIFLNLVSSDATSKGRPIQDISQIPNLMEQSTSPLFACEPNVSLPQPISPSTFRTSLNSIFTSNLSCELGEATKIPPLISLKSTTTAIPVGTESSRKRVSTENFVDEKKPRLITENKEDDVLSGEIAKFLKKMEADSGSKGTYSYLRRHLVVVRHFVLF